MVGGERGERDGRMDGQTGVMEMDGWMCMLGVDGIGS